MTKVEAIWWADAIDVLLGKGGLSFDMIKVRNDSTDGVLAYFRKRLVVNEGMKRRTWVREVDPEGEHVVEFDMPGYGVEEIKSLPTLSPGNPMFRYINNTALSGAVWCQNLIIPVGLSSKMKKLWRMAELQAAGGMKVAVSELRRELYGR